MNSGNKVYSLWLFLALFLSAGNTFSVTLTLDSLLAGFSEVAASAARFTETLTLGILDAPLVSHGTLEYRRSDYLKKEVLAPAHTLLEISGDRLLVENKQKQYRLSLNSQPEIRAFAESYRAILAGDRAALERYYQVVLSGNEEQWTLRLSPIDDKMRERIEYIEVTGRAAMILHIDTLETTGDRSQMNITPDAD